MDSQRSWNEQEILSRGRLNAEQIDNYYMIAKDIATQQIIKAGLYFDEDSSYIRASSSTPTGVYNGAKPVPTNLYHGDPWIDNNLI
jgi:hypothetical protein